MAEDLDRLFVGVPVPPEALAACAALLDGVRARHGGRGVRWVSTENLHLTLRFLGLLPPARIVALGRAVDAAAAGRWRRSRWSWPARERSRATGARGRSGSASSAAPTSSA